MEYQKETYSLVRGWSRSLNRYRAFFILNNIMTAKIVKARKDYVCHLCNGVIRKGNKHLHTTGRSPKLADDHETQIGIEYYSYRRCLRDGCDGVLQYVFNIKEYFKRCIKGDHEFEEQYELDDYVGCHPVGVPTGDYYCVNCGIEKKGI